MIRLIVDGLVVDATKQDEVLVGVHVDTRRELPCPRPSGGVRGDVGLLAHHGLAIDLRSVLHQQPTAQRALVARTSPEDTPVPVSHRHGSIIQYCVRPTEDHLLPASRTRVGFCELRSRVGYCVVLTSCLAAQRRIRYRDRRVPLIRNELTAS